MRAQRSNPAPARNALDRFAAPATTNIRIDRCDLPNAVSRRPHHGPDRGPAPPLREASGRIETVQRVLPKSIPAANRGTTRHCERSEAIQCRPATPTIASLRPQRRTSGSTGVIYRTLGTTGPRPRSPAPPPPEASGRIEARRPAVRRPAPTRTAEQPVVASAAKQSSAGPQRPRSLRYARNDAPPPRMMP